MGLTKSQPAMPPTAELLARPATTALPRSGIRRQNLNPHAPVRVIEHTVRAHRITQAHTHKPVRSPIRTTCLCFFFWHFPFSYRSHSLFHGPVHSFECAPLVISSRPPPAGCSRRSCAALKRVAPRGSSSSIARSGACAGSPLKSCSPLRSSLGAKESGHGLPRRCAKQGLRRRCLCNRQQWTR